LTVAQNPYRGVQDRWAVIVDQRLKTYLLHHFALQSP